MSQGPRAETSWLLTDSLPQSTESLYASFNVKKWGEEGWSAWKIWSLLGSHLLATTVHFGMEHRLWGTVGRLCHRYYFPVNYTPTSISYFWCNKSLQTNGLKQYMFMILEFWKSEVQMFVSELKLRCEQACAPLETLGKNLPLLSQLQQAACISWLMTPNSVFKIGNLTSLHSFLTVTIFAPLVRTLVCTSGPPGGCRQSPHCKVN